MDEQIKAEFERSGFSLDQEEQILQKCLTYCINYKLSPSDLVSHWEVYFLNRQLSGLMVENTEMDGFLSHLQNEEKEKIIKEESRLHIYSHNDVGMLLSDDHDDVQDNVIDTPIRQSERSYLELDGSEAILATSEKPSSGKASKQASNRMTPFGQRTNKFTPLFTLGTTQDFEKVANGEDLENPEDDVIRRVRSTERCSLQVHRSQPEPGCRFMCDRIEDRFNSLENRIKRHTMAHAASGLYGEPTLATVASQKSIFSVGMVCCDGEGRVNEKSIVLQGSVEHAGGERVRLDLQKLDQFSLYPGQVIGIEGHNPSGHCLIASRLIDCLPITSDSGLPLAKKQALDIEYQPDSSLSTSRELSLVIAAGPFTTTDNLLFEPLTDLLSYASRKQPQLLVLIGPFIDSEHPEIKKGSVDRTFEDIFNVEILRRLLDYTEFMGPGVRVVLIPSIRDASHDYVFPQPAFDIQLTQDINHQITCLANPCIFSANEIMFGCCAIDVLKHLSSEEISRSSGKSPAGDRIGRLATHLLCQRSFYPLYPPSLTVPLDLSLASEACDIPSIPDMLLLPSDLAPFVKVLTVGGRNGEEEPQRCMCINPGRLAKGIGGGTFVDMNYSIDPDRSKASIIRI